MKYDSEQYRKFKQERTAAGKLIDPATAEMTWHYAQVQDPYGVLEDLPKRNTASVAYISCARPTVTFGSISAICPRQHATSFGSV